MKKLLFSLILFTAFFSGSFAQTTLSMPDTTLTSNGTQVSIPVTITNCVNVCAITLKITYDPAALTFQDIPDPIDSNFYFTGGNGTINVLWSNINGITIASGTLFTIDFLHNLGNSALTFETAHSELADSNGNPITVIYTNGSITGPAVQLASLGDRVFIDANENGIQDSSETGLADVTIDLFDCNDQWLDYTLTDNDGYYSFDSLMPGDYKLKFHLVDANSIYVFSPMNMGNDDDLDSDVDPNTGFTACVTLNEGDIVTNVDAGVYESSGAVSIGDFVWNDLNGNGIQDSGEPGIENVLVRLLDCSFNFLDSAYTNAQGNYSFSNLIPGTYCIQFELVSNFTFSPKNQGGNDSLDSDADPITGRGECVTLSGFDNNMNIDAGMFKVETYPELVLSKDDGNVFMPDTGSTVTYKITYKNTGNGTLYNAMIVDTLPAGLNHVSGGSSSNNIVHFNIGNIASGATGHVLLTALVCSYESEYLNIAYLTGKGTNNIVYTASAEDLNLCDTTSGGGGSGIESNADMAELLLRRQLKIQHGLTTMMLSKNNGAITSFTLNEFIPESGPFASVPVEVTPFDILGISNALEAHAVDYMYSSSGAERRVGGIFSTITEAPYIYDHTKAICDRLAGYEINEIKLVDVNGHSFYGAKLSNEEGKLTDYAISFSVYETAGSFKIENKWTHDEYSAPAGVTTVYNFQVWSPTYGETVTLVQNIIAKFAATGNVEYMMNQQAAPVTFVKKAKYSHDGKIYLTILNNDAAKQVTLDMEYRVAQGADKLYLTQSYNAAEGETEIAVDLGIISDATVVLNQSQGFADEVFVSGGAYTYMTGETSTVSSFTTSQYSQATTSGFPEGSYVLSGGAELNGQLGNWISLIRSLKADATAYDLSGFNSVRFDARGTGKVQVILDLTTTVNYNYYTHTIDLTGAGNTYNINFSDFSERFGSQTPFDPSKIKSIGFIFDDYDNPGLSSIHLEVSRIGFISGTTNVGEELLPKEFALSQNYPNPFNPSTIIGFAVPSKEHIKLAVYDILGQEVQILLDKELEPGAHSINFNAAGLASGIYFYKLSGQSVNITKKMMLTK